MLDNRESGTWMMSIIITVVNVVVITFRECIRMHVYQVWSFRSSRQNKAAVEIDPGQRKRMLRGSQNGGTFVKEKPVGKPKCGSEGGIFPTTRLCGGGGEPQKFSHTKYFPFLAEVQGSFVFRL